MITKSTPLSSTIEIIGNNVYVCCERLKAFTLVLRHNHHEMRL